MSGKVFTAAESRWMERLKRCIKDMPCDLEIVAYNGNLAVCEVGSLRAFLDTGSTAGTAEYLDAIQHRRIQTHGESL